MTAQNPQKPPETPVALIIQGLDAMRGQLQAVLPSHINVDRFIRTVKTALNMNPDLWSADRRSLLNAASRAAQDGLLPDGREGALVIFKDKSGKRLVSWMPMVFGLIKKIRQSGEIDGVGARIVYENEINQGRFKFVIEEGQEKLYHEPIQYGPRGEKMFVYAYARFAKNGHVEYEPLHRDDVLKRKASSRGGTIWRDWEDEMWRKTAIRALAKRLPLSADILRTVEHEPVPSEFDKLKDAAIQDSRLAMQQLGAPEPETEIPAADEPPPVDDDPADYAKEILQRALSRLEEEPFEDRGELEDFGTRVRDMIKGEAISDELRDRLLGEFQGVFLQHVKAVGNRLA